MVVVVVVVCVWGGGSPKHPGSGGLSHRREGPRHSGAQGPSLAASALENSI